MYIAGKARSHWQLKTVVCLVWCMQNGAMRQYGFCHTKSENRHGTIQYNTSEIYSYNQNAFSDSRTLLTVQHFIYFQLKHSIPR